MLAILSFSVTFCLQLIIVYVTTGVYRHPATSWSLISSVTQSASTNQFPTTCPPWDPFADRSPTSGLKLTIVGAADGKTSDGTSTTEKTTLGFRGDTSAWVTAGGSYSVEEQIDRLVTIIDGEGEGAELLRAGGGLGSLHVSFVMTTVSSLGESLYTQQQGRELLDTYRWQPNVVFPLMDSFTQRLQQTAALNISYDFQSLHMMEVGKVTEIVSPTEFVHLVREHTALSSSLLTSRQSRLRKELFAVLVVYPWAINISTAEDTNCILVSDWGIACAVSEETNTFRQQHFVANAISMIRRGIGMGAVDDAELRRNYDVLFNYSGVGEWETRALRRRLLHANYKALVESYTALLNVLSDINNIPVEDELGERLLALPGKLAIASKCYDLAFVTGLLEEVEGMFFHPTFMPQLYFAPLHKFAVIAPVLVSTGVSVVFAIGKRLWKGTTLTG